MMTSAEYKTLVRLADPIGGMIVDSKVYDFPADEPQFYVQALSYAAPAMNLAGALSGGEKSIVRSASGSGTSIAESTFLALAEVLERHAASCLDTARLFEASANELGSYAIDLLSLPACSTRELKDSRCYVTGVRKDRALRWIEGHSLMTGARHAIPFGLVYLRTDRLQQQEKLQAPISTGLAAHSSLTRAIVSGLLEVIERDALSIMWLQRIPGRVLGSKSASLLPSWAGAADTSLTYTFLDISTDLDVPVTCCIRTAPRSEKAHTLVSSAAGFSPARLIDKTVRDIGASSISFRKPRAVPADLADFTSMHHGAHYMAHRERAAAFDFLLSPDSMDSIDLPQSTFAHEQAGLESPEDQLAYLLQQLSRCGCEAYAVDLTSVEAFSVGMHVVRVIVPGLQPLPYRFATRYLGHSRLYDSPRRSGFRVLPEEQLNPWPLPFA